MDLIFNELSLNPPCTDYNDADSKMRDLLESFSNVARCGFKKIRFEKLASEYILFEGFTFQDWLQVSRSKTLKDLFLASYKKPFIDDDNHEVISRYLEANYYYVYPDSKQKVSTEGLAAAFLYPTLSLSFQNKYWCMNKIEINKELPGTSQICEVYNIFSKNCVQTEVIDNFVEKIQEVTLIQTNIPVADKKIHLRDDHGKDVLRAFADRLVNSPYVESVINSLEFKPRETRFIKNVLPDGKVYLRLTWTDQGLGMAIQTTGRSIKETEAIAKILEETYT